MSLIVRELVEEAKKLDPKYKGDGREFIEDVDYNGFRNSDDPKVREVEIRTKQSFKDQTDINKILKKAQKTGSIAHLQKYPEAVYGEFDGEMDLLTAQTRLGRAQEIFAELPSEARAEFGNNPAQFVTWAADPANNARLAELLPAIAEPGRYFPNPVARGGQGAGAATAPEAVPVEPEPASPPAGDPPAGAGGGVD